MAERAEEQAVKLSQEQQNWPAAVRAWQLAADRFSLLNDLPGEAVALHNLAQAERQLDQAEQAHRHLEQAADLNKKTGRTNEWWRNQIALLQIESQTGKTQALTARFEKLLPLAARLQSHSLQGLFLNEVGLWQNSGGHFAEATRSFAQAEQEFKNAHDSSGVATVSANQARLYEEQKNYAGAIALWKTALVQFQSLREPQGIAAALAGQGRSLLSANQDLPAAEDLLRRAAHNYQLLQKPRQAQAALELLAQCLTAQGKNGQAER
jgi:tetratricopeptide (TPR) repeat protein